MIWGSIDKEVLMVPESRLNYEFLVNNCENLKRIICDSNAVLTDNSNFIVSVNQVFYLRFFKSYLS